MEARCVARGFLPEVCSGTGGSCELKELDDRIFVGEWVVIVGVDGQRIEVVWGGEGERKETQAIK